MNPETINLGLYPVHDLESGKAKVLIEECRKQLAHNGASVLEDFLTPRAVELFVREVTEVLPLTYRSKVTGNAYLKPGDSSLPANHPLNLEEDTELGVIAYDQIPKYYGIRQLYEWDPVLDFLARILGKEKLYRYADPMGALNISVMTMGDYLRWHFDQTDFVASIALQDSEEGGDFEFSPFIRSAQNENYSSVLEVLAGKSSSVHRLPMRPGSLILFEGRNSIHRVTRITGKSARLVALLGYDAQPGVVSTDYLRKIRYGRTS